MRHRLLGTLLTLLTALVMCTAPLATGASAATPAVLSIHVKPFPVLGHEVVTVTGALTPVRVGRTVTLQRSDSGGWKTLGVTHTDAHGAYSLNTRVPSAGRETIRTFLVAADGTPVPSASLVLAPVRPTITLGDVGWVVSGGILRAHGVFAPARPGRRVSLQRKASGHWLTIASTRLGKGGAYSMSGRVTAPAGAASIRVLAYPFNGAAAAASAVHLITVGGTPPALTRAFSGIYLGLTSGSTPGSYRQPAGAPALSFTEDGRVTSAVPPEGPDSGTSTAGPTVRTGVYVAHDGAVDIGWDDGTTVTLRRNSLGQLSYHGLVYGIVETLSGAHLSGSYQRQFGGSGSRITFAASGRFTDQGITGDTNLVTTDNPTGSGTYTVRDNTVYLVYASGPLESMALYVLPQYLTGKARLVLGGTTFRRL